MFGNLRFITIFDNFLLPNQGGLTTHCFCHFLTSKRPQSKMQQHIDFPGSHMSRLPFRAVGSGL